MDAAGELKLGFGKRVVWQVVLKGLIQGVPWQWSCWWASRLSLTVLLKP